jgi:hypothetical protein
MRMIQRIDGRLPLPDPGKPTHVNHCIPVKEGK